MPARLGGICATKCPQGVSGLKGNLFSTSIVSNCWGFCCQDLCERQSSNASPPVNGQFDCNPLHKQNGGTKSPVLARLALDLWEWCLHHNILIEAQYLPGALNVRADRESRVFLHHHDWKLDPLLFTELNRVWGPLGGRPVCLSTFDSTSTVLQLEIRPSVGGSGCIFPGLEQSEGICIPSLCSSRPLPQTVTRPECVTPCSSGTSLELCVAPPILFPHYPGLLTRQGEVQPLPNLHLAGWLLSANHIQKQTFHNQLKPYLRQPGGIENPKPMHQLGKNGLAGVENGNLIRFKLLWSQF